MRSDTLACELLRTSAMRHGFEWIVDSTYQRASLAVKLGDCWRLGISSSRHKKLRQCRERLRKLGPVETRVLFGDEVTEAQVENLLRLEALGWKASSSLRANAAGEAFFREMSEACRAQHLLWFCELEVNGSVIASTSNFHLCGNGFAFQIGVDPSYARFSPGFLLEYGFLEAAERQQVPFADFDSGAQAGSYLETLWPGRIPMISGHLVSGKLPAGLFAVRSGLERAKRSWELCSDRVRRKFHVSSGPIG